MSTVKGWLKRNPVTVEIVHDNGVITDDEGWQHHAYRLRLLWEDGALSRRSPQFNWRQGIGITDKPTDRPEYVLDSLLSDAACYDGARNFDDFCRDLGYEHDSRKAERTYMECGEVLKWMTEFVGGKAEMDRLMYRTERL